MKALHAAGAAGFTDDGIPLLSEETARAAMEAAAEEGVPISFHEENPAFIRNNGINAGKASAHFGIGGSDRQAEIDMVERDVRLAQETGACVVIQHISTKEAVELVRQARRKGADVHAEATPHHFTLTEEAAIRYGTLAKMNPPLREEADRQAIIEGLADGTIDMIATDHAPHSAEEKAKPVTEAPSGIIGLETSLALGISELADTGRLTLTQLIERMSLAPPGCTGWTRDIWRREDRRTWCFLIRRKADARTVLFPFPEFPLPGKDPERKNSRDHMPRQSGLSFAEERAN